ncbi:hypothetical protein R1sor_015236 [Riccia sorocarpa]|uniref:Uncharacterized protein n=1 Tax=Riccia sorocarpa TaxID=122646 RepID=A0ABD3HEE6_9MARC
MARMDSGTLQMFQTFALLFQQEQQAAKQQRQEESRIVAGLRKVADRCDDFDEWNVSSFLLRYTTAMKEFQIPEEEMIRCFKILTVDYVRPEVVEVKEACGSTWDAYQRGLRQQFANRDVEGWADDDLSLEVVDESPDAVEGFGLGGSITREDCVGIFEGNLNIEAEEQDIQGGNDVCEKESQTNSADSEEAEANDLESFGKEDSMNLEHDLDDVGVLVSQLGVEGLEGSRVLLQTDDGKEEMEEIGLHVQGDAKVEVIEVKEESQFIGEELPTSEGLLATNEDTQEEDIACTRSRKVHSLEEKDIGNLEEVLDDDSALVSQLGMDEIQCSQVLLQTNDGKEEPRKMGLQIQVDVNGDTRESTEDSKLIQRAIQVGERFMGALEDIQGLVRAEGPDLKEKWFGNVSKELGFGHEGFTTPIGGMTEVEYVQDFHYRIKKIWLRVGVG